MSTKNGNGQRRIAHFKVDPKSLTTNSEYFTASLRFNKANAHDGNIELKHDDLDAMHVWFIYMQAAKEKEDAEEEAGNDNHAKRRRLETS